MPKRIVLRVPSKPGERLLVLRRYEDSGKFELCDPAMPENENKKRHNQRQVDSVDDAISLIEQGWHPRMWDGSERKMNRVRPASLTIIEVPE